MKMEFIGSKLHWLKFFIALLFIDISSFGQVDTAGLQNLFDMTLTDLMNQKVVTASKYSQKTAEAASSIGTITAEEIKNYGYRTLGEALNSQRGMYLSNDRNYLYLGSRGFSRPTDYNNRIIIMVDGHIMNEIVYGAGTMDNELGINLEDVERIEIVRGPGASVYGSGSMLNIINLIMKKGADIDGLHASAGIGSFGSREFAASFGRESGKTDFIISATGGYSDGEDFYFSDLDSPASNNGVSNGNDWEKYAGIHAAITRNNLKISAGYSDRLKGVPTGAFLTQLTGGVKTKDQRFYFESDYSKKLSAKSNLSFRLFYDYYDYDGSYPSPTYSSFDASTGNWAGAELQYYLEAGKRNIVTAGAEIKSVFRENKGIDLILMDIQLPEINGLEATQIIKSENPEIPIIAITAYAMPGDERKVKAAGCDAYMIKPINNILLIHNLSMFLARKKS